MCVHSDPNSIAFQYVCIYLYFIFHTACSVPVKPDVEILYSPIYMGEFSNPFECDYRFNEIPHKRVKQVFTFEEFSMSSSSVTIKGSSLPFEEYTAGKGIFFFLNKLFYFFLYNVFVLIQK